MAGGFGVKALAVKIGVISLRDSLSGSRVHIMRLSLGIRRDGVCLHVSVSRKDRFIYIPLSDSLFSLAVLHTGHVNFLISQLHRFLTSCETTLSARRVHLGKSSELIRSEILCVLAISQILDSLGLEKIPGFAIIYSRNCFRFQVAQMK